MFLEQSLSDVPRFLVAGDRSGKIVQIWFARRSLKLPDFFVGHCQLTLQREIFRGLIGQRVEIFQRPPDEGLARLR